MQSKCLGQEFEKDIWDFPGGPVVKISPSNAGSTGSMPSYQAEIP